MSYEQHLRSRYVEQASAFANRRKLYLDMRFWIVLRDAALEKKIDDDSQALLNTLRAGVAAGAIVCPLSDSVFAELLKQSDPASRRHTAEIIDELSLGLTLRPIHLRMYEEILHAFRVLWMGGHAQPASEFVWACPSAMLALDQPPPTYLWQALSPKEFADKVWTVSLTGVLDKAGHMLPPDSPFTKAFAATTTRDSAQYASELRSFQDAYDAEVRGAVEIMGPLAHQAMNALAVERGGAPSSSPSCEVNNVLLNAMHRILTKEKYSQLLPTAKVVASLHAALRWDKQRRFHHNDFYDFYHAAAAFGYCDGFFVERSLGSLVATRHINLPRSTDCPVATEIQDCLSIIRSKAGPSLS